MSIPTLINIEDDDWYNSGIWKQDKELSLLYFDIYESVRNSMPVDPAVQEASNALFANRKVALFEKANELGIQLDENGGLIAGQIDKSEWYRIIEPIEKEYSNANSKLWESWREAFQIRFEEAFVEAARNLKLNAEKMK